MADQTVRMVAHVSLGGRQVRVELSNMLNAPPLEIGAAMWQWPGAEARSLTGRIAFLSSAEAKLSRSPPAH